MEDADSSKIPKRIRHLSHSSTGYSSDMEFVSIYKSQPLRTLFIYTPWSSTSIDDKVTNDLLSSLKRLRVLYLSKHFYVTELPKSIGKLKHLRYLNLFRASIRKLPESVTDLYNLQTLILHECRSLAELPAGMESLINLCYLDIRDTRLKGMPPKMGNLTKLQKLTDFVVGERSGSGIEELGKLDLIRGELSIQNLQNVVNAQDALGANLMDKKHLKKLTFKWDGTIEDLEHSRGVLMQLQPHANLQCLQIIGYRGNIFPNWVGNSSFSNLSTLKLSECKICSQLPPLGQLATLKDLSIVAFDGIVSVGPEFYGCCVPMEKPFGSLEILRFERMRQWHEWKDEAGAFPRLRALYVRECPNLTQNLPSYLPCLTTLEIQDCWQLEASLPRALIIYEMRLVDTSRQAILVKLLSGMYCLKVDRFNSVDSPFEVVKHVDGLSATLEDIHISNHSSLECFQVESFPELKRLNISGCANLQSLSVVETASAPNSKPPRFQGSSNFLPIEELYVRDCPKLPVTSVPIAPTIHRMKLIDKSRDVGLEILPSGLHSLRVEKFDSPEEIELWLANGGFAGLEEIIIRDCDPIKCLPLELFPKLTRVDISGCSSLKFLSASEATQGEFAYLISLEIRECPEFSSFPGGLHAPNLSKLLLSKCSSLKLLPEHLLCLLPSLVHLEIDRCPELESFPNRGLPSNLEILDIGGCDKLKLMLEALFLPSTLIHLRISGLKNLKSLHYKELKLLQEMEIWNCSNLQFIPGCTQSLLPSLVKLEIVNCPKLDSFLKGGLPSQLESLVIRDTRKIIAGLMQCDLRMLPCLTDFTIAGYDDVESLPEDTLLPSSLAYLEIFDFKNLKSLGLQHLTSLKHLGIYNCDNLICMPEQELLSSLSSLFIFDCALLSQRCQREIGEDWSKISHIPDLLILPMRM